MCPPCLNFAIYIVSLRNYMLPRRLCRLHAIMGISKDTNELKYYLLECADST